MSNLNNENIKVRYQEALKLCAGAHNNSEVEGWTKLCSSNKLSNNSAFDANIYKKDNRIVIAFAGSNILSLNDLRNDSAIFRNNIPSQYGDAEKIFNIVRAKYPPDKYKIEFMGYSLGGTISNLLSHKTGLPSTAIAPIGSKNIVNSYKYKKYFSFDDSNIVTFGRKGDNLFNSALKDGKQSGKIYVLPDLTVKEAGPYTPVTGNHILGLFRDNDIDKAILHNFYGTGLQIKSLNPIISNPFYTKP